MALMLHLPEQLRKDCACFLRQWWLQPNTCDRTCLSISISFCDSSLNALFEWPKQLLMMLKLAQRGEAGQGRSGQGGQGRAGQGKAGQGILNKGCQMSSGL